MVSEKLLAFANEFNRSARLGLFDPKPFEGEESLDLYKDEEIPESIDTDISPYTEEEIGKLLHLLSKRKKYPQNKAASIYTYVQLFSMAAENFDPSVQNLIEAA